MATVKETDREEVRKLLQHNKPPDTQIMTWLLENVGPLPLVFIDGVVRRRWPRKYFYDLLALSISGGQRGRINIPTRGSYSRLPYISSRMGLKPEDKHLIPLLNKAPWFIKRAQQKLDGKDCRSIGVKARTRRKKDVPTTEELTLADFV